ncbi:SDR family oxidoreductase [Pseudomarimonas salicorniae]|uniref:SDR family oxidoreductase n=1 Tax=Pseudomarimonas salicorniae TaxID=2933270 RepID=A0ABT0GFK0_9GAMM|nr:SDR family oxidoreductase [Lysobacter sp. CAU 1642]
MEEAKGRSWLVIGASRGLGQALCEQLMARGERVIGVARDAAALRRMADRLGGGFRPLVLDLADAAGVERAMQAHATEWSSLHGLIHNAGIGWYRPFLDHSSDELLDLLQVNLGAAMQLCHALLPAMCRRGGGQLLFVASDLARRPLANMAPYVASKHGLAGFAQSLLREFRPQGIRVSLVNPGMIDTGFGGGEAGQGDGHRLLEPGQLAELIVQMLWQPAGLVVDELTVHPMGQADF